MPHTDHVWRSEDSFQESIFLPSCGSQGSSNSGYQTWQQGLYLLSHLAISELFFSLLNVSNSIQIVLPGKGLVMKYRVPSITVFLCHKYSSLSCRALFSFSIMNFKKPKMFYYKNFFKIKKNCFNCMYLCVFVCVYVHMIAGTAGSQISVPYRWL